MSPPSSLIQSEAYEIIELVSLPSLESVEVLRTTGGRSGRLLLHGCLDGVDECLRFRRRPVSLRNEWVVDLLVPPLAVPVVPFPPMQYSVADVAGHVGLVVLRQGMRAIDVVVENVQGCAKADG